MKTLLEFLLNRLVSFPEDVRVEEVEKEREIEYRLHVNPDDMGRIIGKRGVVINSIRAIAKVRAVKDQIKVYVKLVEPEEVAIAEEEPAELAA
jgi:predicted RNA-binding protein YlqC (UPF0109 family)